MDNDILDTNSNSAEILEEAKNDLSYKDKDITKMHSIYDELEYAIKPYIPELERLINAAKNDNDNKALIYASVLGCNVKRCCNYILISKKHKKVNIKELELAYRELCRYLELLGIKTTVNNSAKSKVPISVITEMYVISHFFVNMNVREMDKLDIKIRDYDDSLVCILNTNSIIKTNIFNDNDWFKLRININYIIENNSGKLIMTYNPSIDQKPFMDLYKKYLMIDEMFIKSSNYNFNEKEYRKQISSKIDDDLKQKMIPFKGRLNEYVWQKDKLLKKDDLLNMRIKIHDDFGRLLISTRTYLENINTNIKIITRDELILLWKNMLELMRKNYKIDMNVNPLEEIESACSHLGIELVFSGVVPSDENIIQVLMIGARECLLNAANVNATKFEIMSECNDNYTKIIYTNNGCLPNYPIVEGNGLKSLRELVKRYKGTIEYSKQGKFNVIIKI